MGEESTGLNDITDPAAQRITVHLGDVFAVNHDLATAGLDQTVDHLQGRCLTAARWANEHDNASCRDFERQTTDGRLSLARVLLGDLVEQN